MARQAKEEKMEVDFTLDNEQQEEAGVVVPAAQQEPERKTRKEAKPEVEERTIVNCLRNEKIIVRHIPRQKGNITNPKHVLYGGMSNNAYREFSVPRLSNGSYVNVLTNAEKDFLEQIMNLEPNALSIHRRNENFWDDDNDLSKVHLTKQDTYLDLSKPTDYIKYKILLANKELIAPSIRALTDSPKATYQFVIINEGDETKVAKQNMTNMQLCYKEFGKIEDDKDTLRTVVEALTGRPTAANTSLEWLQTQVNELIQADCRMFLKIVQDELLPTKVLIKRGIEAGVIATRANQYFFRETNTPLCEYGEEATLSVAAKYLNSPKHQEVLFALQAKVK